MSTVEDLKTADCLKRVGCYPVDTRDKDGRETFMVFGPDIHLMGTYPAWYIQYDIHGSLMVSEK